ncbi:hypothetical protein RI065_04720 [Mycoplasmatota bacterium zrk1]
MKSILVLVTLMLLSGCVSDSVKINTLPDYIQECIHDDTYDCMTVMIPDNSYLLFNKGKTLAGYEIYEHEWGPCEAGMEHPLYVKDGITWVYFTSAGCNPDWINRQPIFVHINDSLLSIE